MRDGTTTSVVLTDAIVRDGFRNVAAGANGMSLRTGIDAAVETVVKELKAMAIPVENREQIARVAALSAHEEAIAQQLADALDKVGRDGVVTIEESKALTDELEFVEGVRIDRGYLSPHFVTDTQRMEVTIDSPSFLIHRPEGNFTERHRGHHGENAPGRQAVVGDHCRRR